jgi:hypothetical protein
MLTRITVLFIFTQSFPELKACGLLDILADVIVEAVKIVLHAKVTD